MPVPRRTVTLRHDGRLRGLVVRGVSTSSSRLRACPVISRYIRVSAGMTSYARNARFTLAEKTSMYRLGGTARGYQGIFTTLAAQQSRLWPNRTAGPAVYLYIAALGVNVLNCRDEAGRVLPAV